MRSRPASPAAPADCVVLFLAPGARRLCLAECENAPALEPHLLVALPQPAVARDGDVHRFYFSPRQLERHLRRALGGVEQREAAARRLHCLMLQGPCVEVVLASVDHGLLWFALPVRSRSNRFALQAASACLTPRPGTGPGRLLSRLRESSALRLTKSIDGPICVNWSLELGQL